MNRTTSRYLLALLAGALLAAPAFASHPKDDYEDLSDVGFREGDYGRIRYLDDAAELLRGPSGDDPGGEFEAVVNDPLFPGDALRTGYGERAEVQLANGGVIRLDEQSDLVLQALPDPYEEYADVTLLKLRYGAIQLSVEKTSEEEEFRIDTPAASVYLLGDGDFRVEVDQDGKTRVYSRRGVAEVVGDGGSVLVRGGMRTTTIVGGLPLDPVAFNTFYSDDFDRWIAARRDAYLPERGYGSDDRRAYQEIPVNVRPYYQELRRHGRWVYVADYGYCWYPYDVARGWRPYYNGYWSHRPGGYFWVSHEPWGWAPYHYGRWSWAGGYGWVWIPGRVFGGAWVSWSYGPRYLGWCPLNYYNRPAYLTFGYGRYDYRSWTFVGYAHLGRRHYDRYAVPGHRLGDALRNHAIVTRPPRVAPRRLADDDVRDRELRDARNRDRGNRPAADAPRVAFRDDEPRVKPRDPERTRRPAPPRERRGTPAVRLPADRASRPADDRPGERRGADRLGAGGSAARVPTAVPGGDRDRQPAARRGAPTRERATPATPPQQRSGTRQASPPVRRATPPSRANAPPPRRDAREPADRSRQAPPPSRVRPRTTTTGERQAERVRELYDRVAKPRAAEPRKAPTRRQAEPPRRTVAPRSTPPAPRREAAPPKRSSPPQRQAAPPRRSTPPPRQTAPTRRAAPAPRPKAAPQPKRQSPPKRAAPKRSNSGNKTRKDSNGRQR